MAIKASGQITIVDLTDSRQLSAYLASNLPKVQIEDPNILPRAYEPNWEATNVVITPTLFLNQTILPLNTSGLTITWKRKEGSGSETALITGETITSGVLRVSKNILSNISSNLITYICYVSYLDPETTNTINISSDITYSLIKNATNAKLASIEGEQVFKYDTNSALVGTTQISLNAIVQGVSISKWQYKTADGSYADYPTTADNTNITGSVLNVKPAHAVFFNNIATIKLITTDNSVSDTTTITKIYDGVKGNAGTEATTVVLSNEAQVLAADLNGSVPTTSFVSKIISYRGTTKVTPTVSTPTLPTGMTFSQATANNEVTMTFTVASASTLGGADKGDIPLTIVSNGLTFYKTVSWSKSKTGATGATGSAGINAVVFSIYAPNGTVVSNGQGTLSLSTSAYNGTTAITSGATYQWAKYSGGSWSNISGGTSSSLSVSGSDIANTASYKCTMTYASKTYVDVITLEDKTDSMVATVTSLNGNIFKNGLGNTIFIARLFSNGTETDELKSSNIGTIAPTSPSAGTFWYKVDSSAKTVVLQKYSGTAWANATETHSNTYKWYRRDKNGNALDGGAAFKTGKVIYIDDADVDAKVTFTLEVE